jgi:hypothetical protein
VVSAVVAAAVAAAAPDWAAVEWVGWPAVEAARLRRATQGEAVALVSRAARQAAPAREVE